MNELSSKAVRLGALMTIVALGFPVHASEHRQVELPGGSIDGLAAAIASAGPGGTVIVKNGLHTESGTVVVGFPVRIVGEPGPVIESGTVGGQPTPIPILPTLHVKDTEDVVIQGLQFRAHSVPANTAILIEGSSEVRVIENSINGFEFGIVMQFADHPLIRGNTLEQITGWGILVLNGASATITQNIVSAGGWGIWASDRDGVADKNQVSGSFIGMMLCHLDPGVVNIGGDTSGAHTPCSNWQVTGNTASGNIWGFLIIDGSFGNVLVNNAASGNAVYDIELAGETSRNGFPEPAAHDNTVVAGAQKGLVVKDCGDHDTVLGNVTFVNKALDPCY